MTAVQREKSTNEAGVRLQLRAADDNLSTTSCSSSSNSSYATDSHYH